MIVNEIILASISKRGSTIGHVELWVTICEAFLPPPFALPSVYK